MTHIRKVLIYTVLLLLSVACAHDVRNETASDSEKKSIHEQLDETKRKMRAQGMLSAWRLGSEVNPIKFYFTATAGEGLVYEQGQILLDLLEKETELNFELHVPHDYDEMIQAFGSGRADLALMNSLSYVKAREAYGVSAKLKSLRFNKTTYSGQIIANSKSEIRDLKDLEGKTFAYTDSSSASGFLYPRSMLKKHGVVPKETLFTGSHTEVVRLVYSGAVDAGATYYSAPDPNGTIRDARARLIGEYPDIAEKVKIIDITRPIPNDPIVFGKNVSTELAFQISLGLIKILSEDEAKGALKKLYSIDGFVHCTDADYYALQETLRGT